MIAERMQHHKKLQEFKEFKEFDEDERSVLVKCLEFNNCTRQFLRQELFISEKKLRGIMRRLILRKALFIKKIVDDETGEFKEIFKTSPLIDLKSVHNSLPSKKPEQKVLVPFPIQQLKMNLKPIAINYVRSHVQICTDLGRAILAVAVANEVFTGHDVQGATGYSSTKIVTTCQNSARLRDLIVLKPKVGKYGRYEFSLSDRLKSQHLFDILKEFDVEKKLTPIFLKLPLEKIEGRISKDCFDNLVIDHIKALDSERSKLVVEVYKNPGQTNKQLSAKLNRKNAYEVFNNSKVRSLVYRQHNKKLAFNQYVYKPCFFEVSSELVKEEFGFSEADEFSDLPIEQQDLMVVVYNNRGITVSEMPQKTQLSISKANNIYKDVLVAKGWAETKKENNRHRCYPTEKFISFYRNISQATSNSETTMENTSDNFKGDFGHYCDDLSLKLQKRSDCLALVEQAKEKLREAQEWKNKAAQELESINMAIGQAACEAASLAINQEIMTATQK